MLTDANTGGTLARVRVGLRPASNSRSARRFVPLILVVAALVSPGIASAWFQQYLTGALAPPNSSASSAYNSSLQQNYGNWNRQSFDTATEKYGLTYCRDASSGSCYAYSFTSAEGSFYDSRTISYGRAVCHAWGFNVYSIVINFCATFN